MSVDNSFIDIFQILEYILIQFWYNIILYNTGKLEKLNLQKNIVDIQKEITKLEYEVRDFMDENYNEFSAKLTRDVHLVKKTEQLLTEMNILQSRINDQVCIYILLAFPIDQVHTKY